MSRDERPLVVVTGAAGIVGQAVLPGLSERYAVRAVDRRRCPAPEGVDVRRGNIANPRFARTAMAGADVVVHLAVQVNESRGSARRCLPDRQMATTVLDAAAAEGVRRVVVASSGRVVIGYETDEPYHRITRGDLDGLHTGTIVPIGVDAPPRPTSAYGDNKVAIERQARATAQATGMSVICVRIGTLKEYDMPVRLRERVSWLSHRDAVALFTATIDAADVDFAVVFGTSANRWRIWDLAPTEALGYRPRDDAEPLLEGRSRGDSAIWMRELLESLRNRPFNGDGDRLDHVLRTATLAERAGASEAEIAAALCHDVGLVSRTERHAEVSGAMIAGYVPARIEWAVRVHDDFMAAHENRGLRRFLRYRWRWHPGFDFAERLVDEWDVPARRAIAGDVHPLEHYLPLLERVFGVPPTPPTLLRLGRSLTPGWSRDLARRPAKVTT